jgi:hypothetical protein
MNGKRLYDYAREGIPLPRPIEARPVTISKLDLIDFIDPKQGRGHKWRYADKEMSNEGMMLAGRVEQMVDESRGHAQTITSNKGDEHSTGDKEDGCATASNTIEKEFGRNEHGHGAFASMLVNLHADNRPKGTALQLSESL